MNNNKELRMSV